MSDYPMAEREVEVIDDLKTRVRELSNDDIAMLADPQQPCELRNYRVTDELITALAREVQRLRRGGDKYLPGTHAIDETNRTVSVVGHNGTITTQYAFTSFEDAGRAADMRETARVFPGGLAASWLRAREGLIRRGLIAGEVVSD